MKVEEGDDLNWNHSPVYLTLSSNIVEKESNPSLTMKYTAQWFVMQMYEIERGFLWLSSIYLKLFTGA